MNYHQAIRIAIRALSYDERTEEAERKAVIKALEDSVAVVHIVYQGAYEDRVAVCAAPTLEDAEKIAERLGGMDGDAYASEIPIHTGDVRIVHVLRLRADVNPGRDIEDIREWVESSIPDHTPKRDDVACHWHWRRINPFQGRRPPFWSLEAWGTDHDQVRRTIGEIREKLATDPEYRDRDYAEGPIE